MGEKALARMRDGSEQVLDAAPYETFYERAVINSAIQYQDYEAIYVSLALEQAIHAFWREKETTGKCRVKLRGLGDLPLVRAAQLFQTGALP